ncbi:uncharacterized protein C10orf67 homolog, mitochondrial [Octodon degus]|uniref:Uncharacterized protein C10orf67 homolog, mitochondrial n=1 Tax=Octodon degus TaxID=10160 RepID=A0A6P6DCT7_OCTDE|nr:uncharacterized protein C10orf67 homolog, mitochondrial [Octodon degus]
MAQDPTEDPKVAPGTQQCWKLIKNLAVVEQYQSQARHTISDDLKIGFFTSDHATQTDVSEILPLKDLSSTTQNLVQIITHLQVDFRFLEELVQLKFEERLKEESSSIFNALYDRILEMEKHYQQNEDKMRKSFQQQLADAIAVIKGMYQQYFDVQQEETASHNAENVKLGVLSRKLKEKEEIIKELRDALDQCEGFQKLDTFAEANGSKSNLERENWEYRMENERLLKVISELEEEVKRNIKENSTLEDELISLKEVSEQNQRTIQKDSSVLSHVSSKTRLETSSTEKDKPTKIDQKKMKEKLLDEGTTLKKKIEVLKLKAPAVHEERKTEASLPQDEEKEALKEQIELLKIELEKVKQKFERFRKESERISKNWEKKFTILRSSFHALKDEMFTRRTLFRQFAVVADTSFNYMKSKPLYVSSKVNLMDATSSLPTDHFSSPKKSMDEMINQASSSKDHEAETMKLLKVSKIKDALKFIKKMVGMQFVPA